MHILKARFGDIFGGDEIMAGIGIGISSSLEDRQFLDEI